MNMVLNILLVIAVIIAALFIIALLMKKTHYVKREIVINAPVQTVFNYVKLLKNQDTFNSNAKADAERKKTFRGTDGTVGFVYAWRGNKNAGEGEKEIIDLVEGKKVEAEIRFVKPMVANARIIMETDALSENKTRLSWSNAGTLKAPFNLLIPMMQKSVAKDMDISLLALKGILENGSAGNFSVKHQQPET